MHVGIYLTMAVGWFSATMISLYPIFFDEELATAPARFWARWKETHPEAARSMQARVDGVGPRLGAALGDSGDKGSRFASRMFLTALVLAGMWGAIPSKMTGSLAEPRKLRNFLAFFFQEQSWTMFTNPMGLDTWIESRGELRDGTKVDVFQGGKDPLIPGPGFFYSRWSKERVTVRGGHKADLAVFAKYLCQEWNQGKRPAETDLVKFTIVKLKLVFPNAQRPPEEKELYSQRCYAETPTTTPQPSANPEQPQTPPVARTPDEEERSEHEPSEQDRPVEP